MEARNVSKIGIFRIHSLFLDIDNDGSKDGLCSLKGVIGIIFNLSIKRLQKLGLRCVLIAGERLGNHDEVTDTYDGLLGRLQRSELDSVSMPVFYPLNDSRDVFAYSTPVMQDTMTIFSVYNTTTESHVGDIFAMFASVPLGLWIGYVICFILFAYVSYLGGRFLNKAHSGVWMSVCAFLDQDTHQDYYPAGAKYFALLSSTIMMGLFFIMAYRGGCVSTDLVTVDKPTLIANYDDIINNNVYTGFGKITAEWEKFANAPKGSKERKIFEKHFEVSFSPATFIGMVGGLIKQRKVIVGRPLIVQIASMANLAAPSWPPECGALISQDPQAQQFLTVFVSHAKYKDTPLTKYKDRLTKRMSQAGLQIYVTSQSFMTVIEALFGAGALPPSKLNKIVTHIEPPSSEVIDIGWRQYTRLMITMLIMFGLASVALLAEFTHFYSTGQLKPRGMKRQQKRMIRSYGFR